MCWFFFWTGNDVIFTFHPIQAEHSCSWRKRWRGGALCLRDVQDCHSNWCKALLLLLFFRASKRVHHLMYWSIKIFSKYLQWQNCSLDEPLQVLGTCRSLSLSSDLKSLSVITEVRSDDNNPQICYIQVRCLLRLSVLVNLFPFVFTWTQWHVWNI